MPLPSPITITPRTLMGPGPSDIDPRVLQAMAQPVVGHLDPQFLEIMDQAKAMLQQVFGTANPLTFPVSATGSAGMETCFVNLVEPGDEAIVCIHGVFGLRMADIVGRCGCTARLVEAPWGEPIDPEAVAAELRKGQAKLVAVVHAETSTGVLQPLEPLAALAREHDTLLLVDTVTSLGGVPVMVDEWGLDAVYSGTQKCLSCPPGLSPVTFGPRAEAIMDQRTTKVQSWYLDMSMVRKYWGSERVYHHTAPISAIYGLHEALRIVLEEGLEARYARHRAVHQRLRERLESLGFGFLVEPEYRLPQLNAVVIPEGVDDAAVRRTLLLENNLEIGGGLGALAGKIWRIGLMGSAATDANVDKLIAALKKIL